MAVVDTGADSRKYGVGGIGKMSGCQSRDILFRAVRRGRRGEAGLQSDTLRYERLNTEIVLIGFVYAAKPCNGGGLLRLPSGLFGVM